MCYKIPNLFPGLPLKRLFSILLLLSGTRAAASDGFSFLNAPPAAAPAGMAGAVAAAPGEAWAVFHNPAGLARLDRPTLSFHGQAAWEDVLHEAVSYARPRGRRSAWALTAGMLTVGGLVKTRYDASSPDRFVEDGSVRAGDQYLGAAFARRLTPELDGGAGIKLVKEDLDDRSAWTAALDAGMTGKADDRWRWAVALTNAGLSARFDSRRFSPPMRLQAGARFQSVPWAEWEGDLVRSLGDGGDEFLLGAQFNWERRAFLRAGYRFRFRKNGLGALSGATAGLGGRWNVFEADYSFQPFGDLGGAHRASLSWRFGEQRRDPDRHLRRRPRAM